MDRNIEQVYKPTSTASDHLANERTLLAWIRTGIGIMAFGFVVVKFSLFVRQINSSLGVGRTKPQQGYSEPIGIFLVGMGALSLLLSLLRYRKTKRQLELGVYQSESYLLYLVVSLVFITGVQLIIYLTLYRSTSLVRQFVPEQPIYPGSCNST